MKTNETNRIKLVSMVLACFSVYLIAQSPAKADSPRSWGYWNAGPAAGVGSQGAGGVNLNTNNLNTVENENNGDNLNNSQNTTRVNNRIAEQANSNQILITEPRSEYVAYNICLSNCIGRDAIPVTAGKMYIDIDQEAKPFNTDRLDFGFFFYESNYYNAQVSLDGTYNGAQLNSIDYGVVNDTTLITGAGIQKRKSFYVKQAAFPMTSTELSSSYDGINNYVYHTAQLLGQSFGYYYFGKPMIASQIATQLSLGNTYQFSGLSQLGSKVNVAVNFQKANWSGTWSASKAHNGFSAGGAITSSTLSSNNVKGLGRAGNGFVTGGKVNATLVGAINGVDASKAAVIGNAVVNVQQSVGTTSVGDIFAARAVRQPTIVKH